MSKLHGYLFLDIFNSDTLGIKRGEVRVFYKHPRRSNIFQQVRSVEDFSTRFDWSDLCTLVLSGNMWNVYFLGITPISWFRLSDEALGFLLPLAASGKKNQVHLIVLDFDCAEMRSLSKICPRCFVPPWTWLTKLVSPQLTVYRHLFDLCVLCHPMHPMPPQCLKAIQGKFVNTSEAASSFVRWEEMGTPCVPQKLLIKIIFQSSYDQWSF